jgi:hypothetical protein
VVLSLGAMYPPVLLLMSPGPALSIAAANFCRRQTVFYKG